MGWIGGPPRESLEPDGDERDAAMEGDGADLRRLPEGGAGQALEDLRLSGLRHQDGLRRLLLGGHGRGRGRGRGSVILEPAMGRISTRRPARGNWTWGRVRSPLAGGGWGDPPGPPGGAGTALRVERRAVGLLFLREPRWRPGSVRGRMPAHGRRTARRNLDAKIRRSGRRARRSHPRFGLDHDEASGEGTGRVSPFGSGLRSPGHP